MKWSWKIGRLFGINLYVHGTFLLLQAWAIIFRLQDAPTPAPWLEALKESLFVLIVLVLVLLHELGHAAVAAWLGFRTQDITLLPIGGVARLERLPTRFSQDLVIALAGPAVNLLLAVGLGLWLSATRNLDIFRRLTLVDGDLLVRAYQVNVALVVINLLPALPLDGGRLLRSLLASRHARGHSTQTAAAIGQGMALLFGFLGLFASPLLVIVALCLWIGAAQEASLDQARATLGAIPIKEAMIQDYVTLKPSDSLAVATAHVLAGFPYDFPIQEDGRVVGILTRADLLAALARQGETGLVGEVMRREFQTAGPAETLDEVLPRLQACDCRTVPVLKDGRLVGLITMDRLGEFLMLRSDPLSRGI